MLSKKQKGFTLIELIMVIVILGILAATALPKFADMGAAARTSVLEGGVGAARSAIAIVHSQALIEGKTAASGETTSIEGNTIALIYGYPSKAAVGANKGIDDAVTFTGDLAISSGVIQVNGKTTCQATYTQATSATSGASVAIDDSSCP